MTIAVLMGGPSAEREVSMASGWEVVAALVPTGATVVPVIVDGGAVALPAKVDVHRLHANTPTDGERARKPPAGEHEAETGRGLRRWLGWPRGKRESA